MLTWITRQVKTSYKTFTKEIFIKTSAYSKSSNSSRFKPIFQKFCEMIFEIILSKTMCGIFLTFYLFILKKFNPFTLKKNFAHRFEDLIWQISWKDFFFLNSITWNFSYYCKITHLVVSVLHKRFILLSKCDYLILTQY